MIPVCFCLQSDTGFNALLHFALPHKQIVLSVEAFQIKTSLRSAWITKINKKSLYTYRYQAGSTPANLTISEEQVVEFSKNSKQND
jgi:hypothetical protein